MTAWKTMIVTADNDLLRFMFSFACMCSLNCKTVIAIILFLYNIDIQSNLSIMNHLGTYR